MEVAGKHLGCAGGGLEDTCSFSEFGRGVPGSKEGHDTDVGGGFEKTDEETKGEESFFVFCTRHGDCEDGPDDFTTGEPD